MTADGGHTNGAVPYSVVEGSRKATSTLQQLIGDQLLPEFAEHLKDVTLTTATDGTQIYFPCPFKETEATVALKSVEASVVAALANLRFSNGGQRKIEVDLEQTATFLFSTYIATIGGLGKQDPKVKSKLKGELRDSIHFAIANLKRHRSTQGAIHLVSKTLSKFIRDQECRRILPHSWLTRGG